MEQHLFWFKKITQVQFSEKVYLKYYVSMPTITTHSKNEKSKLVWSVLQALFWDGQFMYTYLYKEYLYARVFKRY